MASGDPWVGSSLPWWGNSTAGWSSTATYPACPHGNNRAFCHQCQNPGMYSPSSPFYHQTYRLGGWQCPGCGRCYNPAVAQCGACVPGAVTTTTGANDDVTDCVPVTEGGLCTEGTCTGGRHCSC